jgi:Surface antigen variable number repeat
MPSVLAVGLLAAASLGLPCPADRLPLAALPASPGPGVYHVGRILFEGNVRTCDRLLRDQMLLNEGDVLDTRLLELSLRRIAGLGFVELPAPVELKPSAEDEHRLEVTIHVRERPRPRFEVGGTLGGIEGGSLSGALFNGSLFGCGERVDLVLQGGSRVEQFGIAFEKPYLFGVESHPAPRLAVLSRGGLRLLLSAPVGPGGAAQPMLDGRKPEPGGWNRIQLEVTDLAREVATLRGAGARFRNDIVTGFGGQQILLDDPSGNPIELFEPRRD